LDYCNLFRAGCRAIFSARTVAACRNRHVGESESLREDSNIETRASPRIAVLSRIAIKPAWSTYTPGRK